ncbi:hypothetical protein J6590_040481 [Homalodisca vitripennis]|nr:hypothetical protein J6590_040481 [Homalodisca vitripennis]
MPLLAVQCARAIAVIENVLTVREVATSQDGRKRATTARDDRHVVSFLLRNRFLTSVGICNELRNVCSDTDFKHVIEELLSNLPKIMLTGYNVNRTEFFGLDKSRTSLRSPDGRERVLRHPWER